MVKPLATIFTGIGPTQGKTQMGVHTYLCFILTSVARAVGPSVTNLFWNLFEFSVAEITLKINISHVLNPNLTK